MKRVPLLVMITDSHLKRGNEEQIIEIFRQAIEKAKRHGFNVVYHIGDWFDSRKYQALSTLKATVIILDMFEAAGMTLRVIPGNHDKPDYESEDSYLDVFTKYPALELITTYKGFHYGEHIVHLIPFFDEKTTYSKYLGPALEGLGKGKNILLTHIAVDGVRNNDGSEMEGVVSEKTISEAFDLTCIGHYHDLQELADGKIVYIGSTHQHNFGEDDLKGMTILYNDLTMEQEKFDTVEYKAVTIDLNTAIDSDIEETIEKYKDSKDHIRIKFSGAPEKTSSVDKNKFKKIGIDVKVKADVVDVDLSYTDVQDFKKFNPNTIIEEWDKFVINKEVDEDLATSGRERLVNILIK